MSDLSLNDLSEGGVVGEKREKQQRQIQMNDDDEADTDSLRFLLRNARGNCFLEPQDLQSLWSVLAPRESWIVILRIRSVRSHLVG